MITRSYKIVSPASVGRQSGMAMLVTLIMLLIIGLTSITSMETSTVQQRMATNQEDRNRAFMAAEKALREGETAIDTLMDTTGGLSDFGQKAGFYKALQAENGECVSYANWTSDSAKWNDDDSVEVKIRTLETFKDMGLASNPRFMVGFEGETDTSSVCYSSTVANGYSDSVSNATATVEVLRFTITSIGYGKSSNTRVLLQETWSVNR